MKTIRQNVFETNSSSTHSISICENSDFLNEFPNPDSEGSIYIYLGYYGWEPRVYKHLDDRLSYVASFAKEYYWDSFIEMFEEVMFENCKGLKEIKYIGEGGIDHQSVDEVETIFESKETLKNFLFNSKSFFETDNDNH